MRKYMSTGYAWIPDNNNTERPSFTSTLLTMKMSGLKLMLLL